MPIWQNSPIGRSSRLGPESDVSELRQRFTSAFQRFSPPPPDAKFQTAQLGAVKGEWVTVERSSANRVILYLHGGGFIAGSPETHGGLVPRLCDNGCARPFSVALRLAPNHRLRP